MITLITAAMSATVPGASDVMPLAVCAREVGAAKVARRLADLPPDIRDDLLGRLARLGVRLANSGEPILDTDAPGPEKAKRADVGFAHAMLVKDMWFVQLRVAMFADVRTFGYRRDANRGFSYHPGYMFGGPACASIKAALAGVTSQEPI